MSLVLIYPILAPHSTQSLKLKSETPSMRGSRPYFKGRVRFGAAVWALDISAPGLSGARTFFFQIRFSVATFFGLQLALLVLGLRTLVGTGSRSTAFKYFFEDEKNRISLSSLIAFSISINTFENLENFLKYEFFFLNLRTWKSFVEFKHSGCLIVGTPHI